MPLRSRVSIGRQVAQALGYLHAKSISARCLSSRNVYLEPKVKLSVLDHGIADTHCTRYSGRSNTKALDTPDVMFLPFDWISVFIWNALCDTQLTVYLTRSNSKSTVYKHNDVWGTISLKPLEIETWFQRTTNRKWSMASRMVMWLMTRHVCYRGLIQTFWCFQWSWKWRTMKTASHEL